MAGGNLKKKKIFDRKILEKKILQIFIYFKKKIFIDLMKKIYTNFYCFDEKKFKRFV